MAALFVMFQYDRLNFVGTDDVHYSNWFYSRLLFMTVKLLCSNGCLLLIPYIDFFQFSMMYFAYSCGMENSVVTTNQGCPTEMLHKC